MLRLIQRLMLSLLLILVVLYVGLLWVARRSDRIIFRERYVNHISMLRVGQGFAG
jgi:hypothetical protein